MRVAIPHANDNPGVSCVNLSDLSINHAFAMGLATLALALWRSEPHPEYDVLLQAQQKQVEAENEARRAAWRAACDAIAQRKTAAADAKAAAERELEVARTQQAAERAQAAIAAAAIAAVEAQELQVRQLSWLQRLIMV